MANGADHAWGAFLAISAGHALVEAREGRVTAAPLFTGGLALACGSLPDLVEPAIHPHHRQFFHSVAFAAGLGFGLHKLYRWQPEGPWQRLLRVGGLVAGVAYLSHLAMDACTKRSIPLVGKLP